jgi:hypothetical protein
VPEERSNLMSPPDDCRNPRLALVRVDGNDLELIGKDKPLRRCSTARTEIEEAKRLREQAALYDLAAEDRVRFDSLH